MQVPVVAISWYKQVLVFGWGQAYSLSQQGAKVKSPYWPTPTAAALLLPEELGKPCTSDQEGGQGAWAVTGSVHTCVRQVFVYVYMLLASCVLKKLWHPLRIEKTLIELNTGGQFF